MTIVWRLFRVYFALSLTDLFTTFYFLQLGYGECNPIARIVYDSLGILGLVCHWTISWIVLYLCVRKFNKADKVKITILIIILIFGIGLSMSMIRANLLLVKQANYALTCLPGTTISFKLFNRMIFSYTAQ